jgi:hypothetical protein
VLLLAAGAAGLACQDQPPDGGGGTGDEMIGTARIALAQVPGDVSCVRITAKGASRTVVTAFDVTPGASATLSMTNLPLGSVEFTGLAYGVACAGIATAMPNWDSLPVTVAIGSSVTATVMLEMRRPGGATVTVDFCLSPSNACSGMVAPCCDGFVCRSSSGTCDVCIASGGTGCASSSECCPGRGLACVDGACVTPPPLDSFVVYRVGEGTARASTSASPVFLDYYSSAGALLFTRPMPTTVVGSNRPFTAPRTRNSDGLITRSQDGRFLVLTGYAAAVDTANVATTTAAAVPRVIARVSTTAIDTSTALTDAASGGAPRSAATADGSRFWFAGSTGGLRTALPGATTSVNLGNTPGAPKQINVVGSCEIPPRVYVSGGGSGGARLGTLGTGLPTMVPAAFTNLPGFPVTGLAQAFFFQDQIPVLAGFDILWVANETAGLSKYSLLESGSWQANGAILAAAGYFGLAVRMESTTQATFFLVRRNGLELESFTANTTYGTMIGDGGAPVPPPLVVAAANTTFRGVALSPQPTALACP